MHTEISNPIRVMEIKQTCDACPSQWEGLTKPRDGYIYIRFRHGILSAGIGSTLKEAVCNDIYCQSIDGRDGFITLEEVAVHLAGIVDLSRVLAVQP